MVPLTTRIMALLVAAATAAAGCIGAGGVPQSDEGSGPAHAAVDPNAPGEIEPAPGHISGIVVDPELVPIPEAYVTVVPGDLSATTNAAGAFKIGPLSDGTYTVKAEKRGYASADAEVAVKEESPTQVTLTLEPMASDVPYHETLTQRMYLICHIVLPNPASGGTFLNAPCTAVYLFGVPENLADKWIFYFKIDKPGFQSLAMEMTWQTQQLGRDGLMQLTKVARATTQGGGVTVQDTVYGDSMANPFHFVIHAGNSYWRSGGKNITFYPIANETQEFRMLIAGGGGNTTVNNLALFIEFRPTAYLTLFYNRRASDDFTILPDR